MSTILQKIRDAVSGKKTIITAVIGLLTAALAWSAGELTDWQALAAAWVAIQVIFIRVGNKKNAEVHNRKLVTNVVTEAYDLGYESGRVMSNDGYDEGFVDGYEQGDNDARYEDG